MIGLPRGIGDGRENVFVLKERIIFQNLPVAGSVTQQIENVRDTDSLPANARPAAALVRLHGDAFQKIQVFATTSVKDQVVPSLDWWHSVGEEASRLIDGQKDIE